MCYDIDKMLLRCALELTSWSVRDVQVRMSRMKWALCSGHSDDERVWLFLREINYDNLTRCSCPEDGNPNKLYSTSSQYNVCCLELRLISHTAWFLHAFVCSLIRPFICIHTKS